MILLASVAESEGGGAWKYLFTQQQELDVAAAAAAQGGAVMPFVIARWPSFPGSTKKTAVVTHLLFLFSLPTFN